MHNQTHRNLSRLLKINKKRSAAITVTLAMLISLTGCAQPHGLVGTHTKHQLIADEEFTGETLPATMEAKPQEEIEQNGITPEDVLAIYDQWAMVALHHWWSDSKDRWGDDFNNITATFNSITPVMAIDYDFETEEKTYRMKAYYTASLDEFDGTNYWQNDPKPHDETIYPITVNIDVGYKGEVFSSGEFELGISEADFLPIAEGFGSEPFEISVEKLIEIYGKHTMIANLDAGTGYSAFIIDRQTILGITDPELLWSLYNAAKNSLYSLNFRDHYNTYHDLTVIP